MQRRYHVYILASLRRTLYVGVTGELRLRLAEHRSGTANAFTHRYRVTMLVYSEEYRYVVDAIRREKQIKGWLREKKIALVTAANPDWRDLSADLR
jgi:putative endonuclease